MREEDAVVTGALDGWKWDAVAWDMGDVLQELRREHHNETIGILICGTKNDRSARYSLGRSTSPMAVAAYTYDKLPAAEQKALPNEGHLVAALARAEPDAEVIKVGYYWPHTR